METTKAEISMTIDSLCRLYRNYADTKAGPELLKEVTDKISELIRQL